jgi:nicotinic acid mononucleotide adenylyltransferase
METRFPTSKRTYTKLKDMQVCGADINVIHVSMTTDHLETWEKLIGNRKSPLASAAVIGWDTLFQLFTRQITLQDLAAKASARIGINGRIIIWDKAEPCMDVDKPHQLEIMREDLELRKKKDAAAAKRKAAPAKKITSPKVRAQVKTKAKLK